MKRVYLGNLSYGLSEQSLQQTCEQFGAVTSVKIIIDNQTGKSRGFAFVEMETEEAAAALIEKLNGQDLDGRKVIASIAKERTDSNQRRNNRPFKKRFERSDSDRY